MIHENVELHNIEEVHAVDGHDGVRMQRCPEKVRTRINEGAQTRMLCPANAEIRFVCDSPTARVTISATDWAHGVVFFGPFQQDAIQIGAERRTIELTPCEYFDQLDPAAIGPMPFSPRVRRLLMTGGEVFFHGVEGEGVRPPRPDELPKLRLLTYGTSITHGSAASGPHLNYAAQTARRLGADLINLGVGGSCHCEPELADYIAARPDWDIAVLALSVNMTGGLFTIDQFYERVSYMVNTVAAADPRRPVACVTIYPYFGELGQAFRQPDLPAPPEEFRRRLRQAVAEADRPNLHLIEGPEILTDPTGLTTDLVHPADNGMIQMGENLARKLAPLAAAIGK